MDFVTDTYKILCSCNGDYEDYLSSKMQHQEVWWKLTFWSKVLPPCSI